MDFPVDDVLRNIRYFLGVVKKATGNARDSDSKTENKPGVYQQFYLQRSTDNLFPANAITKVILSSRQGPGIQIADA